MASSTADGDEIDPLDAFMASVSAELAMADAYKVAPSGSDADSKRAPELLEADDPLADYIAIEPSDANDADDTGAGEIVDDDVAEVDDRDIATLPFVDHSSRNYARFRRDVLKVGHGLGDSPRIALV